MQKPIAFISKKKTIVVLRNCLLIAERLDFRSFKLKIIQSNKEIETKISVFAFANLLAQINPIRTITED